MKNPMGVDMSEKGLEDLIVSHLCGVNGFRQGTSDAYNKKYALVPEWLEAFLRETQPKEVEAAGIFSSEHERNKFFSRLSDEIGKVGISRIFEKGFLHNGQTFTLYFPVASEGDSEAERLYAANCFGVIRQLHYSEVRPDDSIDIVLFVNGLAFLTMELKNHYTKQRTQDAIKQYQRDRKPEWVTILRKKQCAVHFAVDDREVWMCTELKGEKTYFLPFNRGDGKGGAGNRIIPNKTMTSYLWEEILTKASLSNIIENYARVIVEEKEDEREKKYTEEKVIWPRYHQLEAVMKLEAATKALPVGQHFLIQHSAGSGKSNTITWLAYRLLGLKKFNSILVVTDRVNLDGQIRDNLLAFQTRSDLVGWATCAQSSDEDEVKTLKKMLENNKPIIVTTVHKFSFILNQIEKDLSKKKFAILIDEAHSSQAGEMAGNMAGIVAGKFKKKADGEEVSVEDKILALVGARKLAKNANYYAFTATPKNKTLEMFGTRDGEDEEGKPRFMPFHTYTMRQAIEEGFILDVLAHYTPYKSLFTIVKKIAEDPEFDKKKSMKRLRTYVESQPETIEAKAKIIVEHFCTRVYKKIGGKARAMVVTSSIERAIEFYKEITKGLEERGSKYKAIVAFTNKEINHQLVTPKMYNGFETGRIEKMIKKEPYRILVVADMFQTGYDEPLLHTMYVDKVLADVKAVQTLSRLNRSHPDKNDTFVLDFANDPEVIRAAFQKYYEMTSLAGESDINKLNDLIRAIEIKPFYEETDRDEVMNIFLSNEQNAVARQKIDSILDGIVKRFGELDEDGQIAAKSAMKTFCRDYPFLAAITELSSTLWEKYYGFYSLLVTKLPILRSEDHTQGLLQSVAFDKFGIRKFDELRIELKNENAVLDPVPIGGTTDGKKDPELERISEIVKEFNKRFGAENIKKINEIAGKLAVTPEYKNAVKDNDKQTVDILSDRLITDAMNHISTDIPFVTAYYKNKDFFRDMIMRLSKYLISNGELPNLNDDDNSGLASAS